jgi:hypothetical protein
MFVKAISNAMPMVFSMICAEKTSEEMKILQKKMPKFQQLIIP